MRIFKTAFFLFLTCFLLVTSAALSFAQSAAEFGRVRKQGDRVVQICKKYEHCKSADLGSNHLGMLVEMLESRIGFLRQHQGNEQTIRDMQSELDLLQHYKVDNARFSTLGLGARTSYGSQWSYTKPSDTSTEILKVCEKYKHCSSTSGTKEHLLSLKVFLERKIADKNAAGETVSRENFELSQSLEFERQKLIKLLPYANDENHIRDSHIRDSTKQSISDYETYMRQHGNKQAK